MKLLKKIWSFLTNKPALVPIQQEMYAYCPTNTRSAAFTKNKFYKVQEFHDDNFFTLISNHGFRALCKRKGCAHLNGQNWELIPVEDRHDTGRIQTEAYTHQLRS